MTRKLIALVDGSVYSKTVCDHAIWIAGRTGMDVELMHVLGRRETGAGQDLSGSITLGARSALLEQLAGIDEQRARLAVQRGRAILEDAQSLLEQAGITASEYLRHGDLIEAVSEKEDGADLIVMGKRGEGADFARGHLGSNLERVMRATTRPLFVASRAFNPIEKVLIAFDGSANAIRAVEHVSRNPLYAGLPLEIVTVGPDSPAAKTALADVKSLLIKAGFETGARILPGQPEEVLGKLIETENFGHMVMGAAGNSRLRALFVGSTALEMIRSCKVPILLIR